MRQLTLILSIVLIVQAGSARGAFVGVFFEEDTYCDSAIVPPLTVVPAYLVFAYLTAPTINAWEINLSFNNVTLVSLQTRTDSIIISPWPGDYMCGLAQPQPITGERFVAADLMIMAAAGGIPGEIVGDGVHFHLLPEKVPCYTDAEDNAYALEYGRGYNRLAVVNNGHACIVGEEMQSFGSIKGLFR